jgi:hypothetical protein
VAASGRVESGSVLLDSLLLESPESRLRVMGTFPLDLGGLAPGGLDLSLAAEPLHMRDLGPLLPTLVSDSIRLWAGGTPEPTEDVLDGGAWRLDSRGAGRLELRGEVEGELDDPRIRGRAIVEGLDLQAWGVSPDPMIRGHPDGRGCDWKGRDGPGIRRGGVGPS